MTKADELYLRKFMGARDHKDIARIDKTNLHERQYVGLEPVESDDEDGPDDDGNNNDPNMNDRLFKERNKGKLPPDQLNSNRSASGDKVTLTSKVFGSHRYFAQKEDTTED